jgi:hypothetical protein
MLDSNGNFALLIGGFQTMTVPSLYVRHCPMCGKTFSSVRQDAKYDRAACRSKASKQKRRAMATGFLPGIPRLYDYAINCIQKSNEIALCVIKEMIPARCGPKATKMAILSAFLLALDCEANPADQNYAETLHADCVQS